MAKKQGISYSPNTALIQGAGVAYRNYDNMPGMYKGLDELTDAGIGMITQAGKDFEAEKKKKEEEAKAAEAEKAKQDKDWYDISGSVYENAGSFMKDVEYKDTVSRLTALKPRLIEAQKSGNPEEIAAVMTEFNNIKASVDDHKAFRETITNPEYGISDAMKHSGIVPGDNGEDHNFLTGLVKEDYTIVRKNNETYYNVGGVEKTMKEIKDMTILKDNIPYATYSKAINDFSRAKNFDRDNTEYFVRNNVVPQETNKLRAFLADSGFGNGETFLQLLNKEGNRASIEQEIMNSVFNTNGGGIDDKEWENFTNAIVDPKNEFWKGDENAWKTESTRIATEQLTNGIENKWNNNQKPTVSGDGAGTGFLATANTKKPKGVMSGTLDRSFNYNISKNMYDQFKLSSEGKPAEFSIGSTNYKYDVENNNWVQTTGDGTKKDLGDLNATLGPKGFAIVDPDFLALRTAATEITENTNESIDLDTENRLEQDISKTINNIDVKTMNLDDNVVAENIQKYLPLRGKSNPKGYQFLTTQDIEGYGLEKGGGDPFKEGVTLYELAKKGEKGSFIGPDGNRIKAVKKDGKNIFIKTGGDLERRREGIKELDKILNLDEISKILLSKPRA